MKQKEKAVYKTISALLWAHASRFDKKHGHWFVRYCPQQQVVVMDTWNGHIYQAHNTNDIVNDGHVDGQIRSGVHTVVTERDCDVGDGILIFKTLLKSID